MPINGAIYDWEDVKIVLPSGETVGLTDINYEDGRDVEMRYGKGAVPRGVGRKNYEASGNCTLDSDEFQRLQLVMGGSMYNTPVPIIVSYGSTLKETVTDVLPLCWITKTSTAAKQGEPNVREVKLDFKVSRPILWNGVPAYTKAGNLIDTIADVIT